MSLQWKAEEITATDLPGMDEAVFDTEPSTSYPPSNLVTIRYLWDAVRRHTRVWLCAALVGLLAGVALQFVLPPASEASVTLVLTHREGDDPARAVLTDLSLLESLRVAEGTVAELGLAESGHDLQARYAVEQVTTRVVEVTASAPSDAEATTLAATLADTFLKMRAEQIAQEDAPLLAELEAAADEVAEARDAVLAAGGDPDDPDPPPTETAIKLTEAREREQFIEHQLLDQEAQRLRMNSSRVLDAAAPVPSSERAAIAISSASGLAGGLFAGLAFVLVRAMISDRLWRREDIAYEIGSPVGVSVGRPPRPSWATFPRLLRRSVTSRPAVQVVVDHLRTSVPWNGTSKPALAIVSVDNVGHSAIMVASLALSLAHEGKRVLVADLTGTGKLAATLGVTEPGTHESQFSDDDVRLTVHAASAGPVAAQLPHDDGESRLGRAWFDADVVLTLVTVSPALGAEHVRPWATTAAAIVTAGKSSVAIVHATGELVRLAGLELETVVLLRTDPTDKTVGKTIGKTDGDAAVPWASA